MVIYILMNVECLKVSDFLLHNDHPDITALVDWV